MQSGPPQFIDPARLADTRDELSGVLSIDDMLRLQALVTGHTDSIQFDLRFDRDDKKRIRISGRYSACLIMACQRCLQAIEVEIVRPVNVVLLANEDDAETLPEEVEPMLMTTKVMSLPMFLEEELLLALPLAPRHDTSECHVTESQSDKSVVIDRQHPFEVLKDLKLKNSKD